MKQTSRCVVVFRLARLELDRPGMFLLKQAHEVLANEDTRVLVIIHSPCTFRTFIYCLCSQIPCVVQLLTHHHVRLTNRLVTSTRSCNRAMTKNVF